MSTEQSVSRWLSELRGGRADAVQSLWDRFFARLVELASKQIRVESRPVTDAEDVAASVLQSIWQGAKAGRLRDCNTLDEIWWLLVAMARRKCIDHARRATAAKRGGRMTRLRWGEADSALFEDLVSKEPDPQLAAAFNDEYVRLLELLDDPRQQEIAKLKIEGYTNREIGERLKLSEPTIERKLRLVRDVWTSELKHAPVE